MSRIPFFLLLAPLFVLACGGDDTVTPVDASTDSAKSDATTADASPDGSSGDGSSGDGAAACAAPATCVAVSACAAGQGHLTPGDCSGGAAIVCCSPQSACPAEDFLCCSSTAQFRPSCVNGALVCDSPLTRCTGDGGSDAPTDG